MYDESRLITNERQVGPVRCAQGQWRVVSKNDTTVKDLGAKRTLASVKAVNSGAALLKQAETCGLYDDMRDDE